MHIENQSQANNKTQERDAAIQITLAQFSDDAILERARLILKTRLRADREILSGPETVREYLRFNLANLEHEVFGVLWLDSQNRLIEDELMFRGTLSATSVWPREVVKSALRVNAGACIFYHNHPSGVATPSRADETLTKQLKSALALVDVRSLDHLIVAGAAAITSFAEQGLM